MVSRTLLLACISLLGAVPELQRDAGSSQYIHVQDGSTSSGLHRLEVWAPVVPLKRGIQNLRVRLVKIDSGQLAKGCRLSLQPWMPDMGHGIEDVPVVIERSTGQFEINGLDLFMPGKWELRFQVTGCETSNVTLVVHLK